MTHASGSSFADSPVARQQKKTHSHKPRPTSRKAPVPSSIMGTLLMYRDLPGGPTKVKFADEISRHCLCGQCGMISLSMFQDPGGHMFCDACLHEQSTKHHIYDIYCTYERKRIDINEMFEARDLITILREQYVDCPNQQNCNTKVQLQNLRDHYVLCKQRVQCTSCDQSIETKKRETHVYAFKSQQDTAEAAEKSSASVKTVKERGYQEEQNTPVLCSHNSRASKPSATQKYSEFESAEESKYLCEERRPAELETAATQPRDQVMSAMGGAAAPMQHNEGENGGPAMMQECGFCQRNVKQRNMPRHRENCTKAPKPCVYCEEQILPVYMPSHMEHCTSNPDNVHTCNAEAAAATAAADPDPVDQSSDNSAFYFEHNTHVGGTPAWFQYLASGDWLSAFVAMEESLTFQRMEEESRYALLAPALVFLGRYSCVEDFLAQPSPVQQFDCLLAALFVRAFLPRSVFSRTQEVSWTQALQYLPHFLASRLSEEAVAYLCAYPVFLEEIGSLPVDVNRKCTTERQPRPNPEPLTITEERASRTTVNTLQGEKKDETGTSECVLREQAAALALLGKSHSALFKDESSSKPSHFSSDFVAFDMTALHVGAPFQKDMKQLSVESRSDDSAKGEDADCTVYLNDPPPLNRETSQQARSHLHHTPYASALSTNELLYAALERSPRQLRGLLFSAAQSSPLQQHLACENPRPVSTVRERTEGTPALHGVNSTTIIVTSSANSTASAGTSEYPSTELSLMRNDSREIYSRERTERAVTCRELAAKLQEGTSSEYATYMEVEHSADRSLHQLCTRGPYCECRSTAPVSKQYRDTKSGTGRHVEHLKQYPGRPMRVSAQEQSPGLNGNPPLPSTHSFRWGIQTSRNGTGRHFTAAYEADEYALNVDGVSKQNFEDVANVDE
ncbi:uncharacterized protein LOC142564323 isoform X3 [Dermacentor variabilis]|uniref:uncharacterized protein LOC142564323 isoform X3 n=1 Tax=Dermacentor variabilis TaxID=34621 RepID=UPI003F5C9C95